MPLHFVTTPNGATYTCTCTAGSDHEVGTQLMVWTIYRAPADFPSVPYVVRGWLIIGGDIVDSGALGLADSLEQARTYLPQGLSRFEPSPGEDPVVVESWL